MKVLSAEQMRVVDRLTTERHGIPGLQLMENAAASVADETLKSYGPFEGKQMLVVCGRGNNGGDGAAVARLLHEVGARVHVVLLGRIGDSKGDARINFERARSLASNNPTTFVLAEASNADEFDIATGPKNYDLYFDALFGTGLARPAEGIYRHAIEFLNGRRGKAHSQGSRNLPAMVAVDIPSGLASDSAETIGPAVRADLTVTLTAPKLANVLPPACYYGGRLVVRNIGSPDDLIESRASHLNLIDEPMVTSFLRDSRRRPDANKGDAGKVLIIAGSAGKTGAACLAGEAAMRSGAGLVTVATAESSQPVVASRLLIECMTEPLAETPSGAISVDAVRAALELAKARDVFAIGPGIGSSDSSTRDFVHDMVSNRIRPLVLDADGLNALAPWPDSMKGSPELPIVLTPHPGEMARLAASSIAEILRDRVDAA
ncbi:MAG TPA: NAD(P)H-hydrate epimerase, partial [Blastocatellia bacterium]|nr:NAD(P)H-hydrate epimerase [Blastocatellia bacterium]